MGEPRSAGLLAAPRAARPYPLDHVLNADGNRAIGSKMEEARFQMRGSVAVWQHAGEQSWPRAGGVDRAGAARFESEIPGCLFGRSSLSVIGLLNATRGMASPRVRARLPCERPRHFEQRWPGGRSCETQEHSALTTPVTALEPAFRL